MKKELFFSTLSMLICSCSNKFVLKKSYVYREDSKRILSLNFPNDSVCVIKNIYNSDGNESKQIDYTCKYSTLSKDYLLLTNNSDMIDTAGRGFFFFPLNYVDTPIAKQNNTVSIIPNYSDDNYKYLKVPYVEYDTLIRYKRTIAWIKKDRCNRVVGYYKFKPN